MMGLSLRKYGTFGRTGTTAATAGHYLAVVWNPSSDSPMFLEELMLTNTQAVADNVALRRVSAFGTADSTVTPTASSEYGADRIAPPSGALLKLGPFSPQPTAVDANSFSGTNLAGSAGAGVIWIFNEGELCIPPGEGIGLLLTAAVAAAGDVAAKWGE